MRKSFKTITAAALSAAMILTPAMTSFAENAPAVGNVLAYSNDTVVVPTTIKLALNPAKYEVVKRAAAEAVDATYAAVANDATYSGTTKYFTKATVDDEDVYTEVAADTEFTITVDDEEKVVTLTKDTWANVKGDLYVEATKAKDAVTEVVSGENDQIVSLNYGIISESTSDRLCNVSFTISYTDGDGTEDIEFVGTQAEVTAAEAGDHKLYLAVAPSTVAPKTYDNKAFGTTVVAHSGLKADNIDGDALSDVTMTAATAGLAVFATGEDETTVADMAYVLPAATYSVKNGEKITFATTQAALKDMVELDEIEGVIGFTFVGAMNTNTDWTEAKATQIKITPEYDFTETTVYDPEDENLVDGAHLRIYTQAELDAQEAEAADAAATAAANTFKTTYAATLALEVEDVEADDLDDINTALEAYEALDAAAKAKLTTEKALLDSLKTAAEALATVDAYVSILTSNGTAYLVVKPSETTTFDGLTSADQLTSFQIKFNEGEYNDVDAMVVGNMVGISYADAKTALGFDSLTSGDEISLKVVYDETTYVAVYVQE